MGTERTGLAAEVPTLELNETIYEIPALIDAFDCCLYSMTEGGNIHLRSKSCGGHHNRGNVPCVPAPTRGEMLVMLLSDEMLAMSKVWMRGDRTLMVRTGNTTTEYDITNPDALARACLEAAKEAT